MQFRFLGRLLFVHGIWNYKRLCKVILYSFYKNITLYVIEVRFFRLFLSVVKKHFFEKVLIKCLICIYSNVAVVCFVEWIFWPDSFWEMAHWSLQRGTWFLNSNCLMIYVVSTSIYFYLISSCLLPLRQWLLASSIGRAKPRRCSSFPSCTEYRKTSPTLTSPFSGRGCLTRSCIRSYCTLLAMDH